MDLVKMALADAVITFAWVSCASTMGIFTSLISSALEMRGSASILLITTILVFLLVFVFNLIGEAMGGASFNPTGTASFYAAGVGNDNLISMAFRLPAQAAGAVGGSTAITEFIPMQYRHMLGAPYLKVDLHTGAVAEGILTFIISFIVLFIILRGPNSVLMKTWLLAISTVALIVAGSDYTGPSMNPANAFGWAYVNNRHNTWEQLYVYWVCPFVGAVLAAWTFRFIFPPAKQKKA